MIGGFILGVLAVSVSMSIWMAVKQPSWERKVMDYLYKGVLGIGVHYVLIGSMLVASNFFEESELQRSVWIWQGVAGGYCLLLASALAPEGQSAGGNERVVGFCRRPRA